MRNPRAVPRLLAARARDGLWNVLRALIPENRRLAIAWRGCRDEALDSYLVSGYQSPWLNVQSILTRHVIARRLFGATFADLEDAELRFAIELNAAMGERAHELGVRMGAFLDSARAARVREVEAAVADRIHVFEARWAEALADREAGPLRVVELACGSANDYRSWADFGLARFLDYSGFDLSPANVANALRRYPGVDFRVGNILALPLPDASADLVVAADIFEHLSLASMEHALDEATRITRDGLALTFFNMAAIPDHEPHPKGLYHRNRLSRARIEARLAESFDSVEVIPIATWLQARYGFERSYNRNAVTIVAAAPHRGSAG